MSHQDPSRVPAAPNASLVRGRVLRVGPAPGGDGRVWELHLERSDAGGGLADLAQTRVGASVEILVHPGFRGEVRAGDRVEARVAYQGDERGGAFFLQGDDCRVLPATGADPDAGPDAAG